MLSPDEEHKKDQRNLDTYTEGWELWDKTLYLHPDRLHTIKRLVKDQGWKWRNGSENHGWLHQLHPGTWLPIFVIKEGQSLIRKDLMGVAMVELRLMDWKTKEPFTLRGQRIFTAHEFPSCSFADLEHEGGNIGRALQGPIRRCSMTRGSDCTVKLRPVMVHGQLGKGRPAWRDHITAGGTNAYNGHLIITTARRAEELSALGDAHARAGPPVVKTEPVEHAIELRRARSIERATDPRRAARKWEATLKKNRGSSHTVPAGRSGDFHRLISTKEPRGSRHLISDVKPKLQRKSPVKKPRDCDGIHGNLGKELLRMLAAEGRHGPWRVYPERSPRDSSYPFADKKARGSPYPAPAKRVRHDSMDISMNFERQVSVVQPMPKLDEEPHFNFRGPVPSPTPPVPEPLSPSPWCAPIEDEVSPDVVMALPEPEAMNVTMLESEVPMVADAVAPPESGEPIPVQSTDLIPSYGYEDFMREFNRPVEEECPDLTLPEPVAYGSKRLPEDSE
uniref:DUF4283 domain-containing protein n=1 Tax=Knipowitschia caucasica TaxID=637954 RepID=A0AAV2LFV5_KNICA